MFFLSFLGAASAVLFNPMVSEPRNTTYFAGQTVPIRWSKAQTGQVNIDVVSIFSDVMSQPVTIASGVPAEQGVFNWQVPAMLKSAVGYKVRVWGSHQPANGDTEGVSQTFTIINNIPDAVNGFIVLTPNAKSPCKVGQPCKITWDFPPNYNPPADVHIGLYQVGQTQPIAKIATVPSAQKSFTWNVPEDATLLKTGQVYISVDGGAKAGAVPKMAGPLGSNSDAFKIAPQDPAYKAQQAAEQQKKAEAEKKAKEEADKKKKEEAEKKAKEEAEKKAKEEAEKKKKEQEAKNAPKKPAGRINQQKAKNSSSPMIKAGEAALVAAFLAALLL